MYADRCPIRCLRSDLRSRVPLVACARTVFWTGWDAIASLLSYPARRSLVATPVPTFLARPSPRIRFPGSDKTRVLCEHKTLVWTAA
jgi:hypothetical protein